MAARSEASITRAMSVAFEATTIAQPAEAATSTAIAIAQTTEASIATAQASIVVAVRGGEFGLLFKART